MSKVVSILGHTLTSNVDGMFDLNDLWRGAGLPQNKRPSEWRGSVKDSLIQSANLRSENGGINRGTWATESALYAYAMWVSVDFYMAVVEAFTHAANGDGEAAVEAAQRVVGIRDALKPNKKLKPKLEELKKDIKNPVEFVCHIIDQSKGLPDTEFDKLYDIVSEFIHMNFFKQSGALATAAFLLEERKAGRYHRRTAILRNKVR